MLWISPRGEEMGAVDQPEVMYLLHVDYTTSHTTSHIPRCVWFHMDPVNRTLRRPGIEEVGGLIVGQIMTQLERVSISEQKLARALTLEKAHRRGGAGWGEGPGSPARLASTPAHVRYNHPSPFILYTK